MWTWESFAGLSEENQCGGNGVFHGTDQLIGKIKINSLIFSA
jgi:hypothetical protein